MPILIVMLALLSPNNVISIEWNVDVLELDKLHGPAGNVVVAVIDTGLDINHPDFVGKIWINENEIPDNGIDDDNNGYIDDINGWDFQNNDNNVEDDSHEYHGTHVTGIIASEVVGVSPNTTIMPLKTMDPDGNADFGILSEGVRYAVNNGADIISMSFGGREIDSSLYSAIAYAKNSGVIMVAASGNEGSSFVHYPAQLDGVIAVGSINDQKVKSTFSNFGSTIDFVAPGEVIRSTVKSGEGLDSSLMAGGELFNSIPMQYSNVTNSTNMLLMDGENGLLEELVSINGSVVLIERGGLTFGEMAQNVMIQGGLGMIVYNNVEGSFAGTLGTNHNITAVSVNKEKGLELKDLINGNSIDIYLNVTSGDYAWNSGTSMAVPHVTGVISLMKMKNPLLSNELIERVLQYTSEDLGQEGHDASFGYGLVNGAQINKIMNDVEKPEIEYNIWNEVENLSGAIEFELNITVRDLIGLYELEFEYLDGNEINSNTITAKRNEIIQVSLGFRLHSTQNKLEIILRGSDIIGNVKELTLVYERDERPSTDELDTKTGIITIVETIPTESDNANVNPISLISAVIVIVNIKRKVRRNIII